MMYTKKSAGVFCMIVIIAMLVPILQNWRQKPVDDFPLSYYPMFSAKRESLYGLYYFVGYDQQNQRHVLPYSMIGVGGFNQVRRQVNKSVRKKDYQKMMKRLSKKIAGRQTAPYSQLKIVHLVKGSYDINTYFSQANKTPVDEQIIAIQKIER